MNTRGSTPGHVPDTLCIYHGNCPDGFGAAWAVRNALGSGVRFHKGIHQQAAPDVTGLDVILVDFSYKRDTILQMLKTAASITILDHHITAAEELSGLLADGELSGELDLSRSGAMLAWQWFNGDTPVPRLIAHIQDRDLWQFRLDGTREITTALSSYPYDFEVWDSLMAYGPDELAVMIRDGKAIERKLQQDIARLIESGVRRMVIGGYDVPVLNVSSAYVSDAGNLLSVGEPFAACYWDHRHGRSFSLRSSDQDGAPGVDVARVAGLYGGGGHVHAAGFTAASGWEGDET